MTEPNVALVRPSIAYRESYLAAMAERVTQNPNLAKNFALVDLPGQIRRWEAMAQAEGGKSGEEQTLELWLIEAGRYIGNAQLRNRSIGRTPERASHLAYYLIPAKNTRTYKVALYRLIRTEAKAFGLSALDIVCFRDQGDCCGIMEELAARPIAESRDIETGEMLRRYRYAL